MIDTPCGNALSGELAVVAATRPQAPTCSFRCSGGQNLAGAITGVSRANIRHESAAFGICRQVRGSQRPGFLGISTSERLREQEARLAISIAMVINPERHL